nr:lipoprotein [Staphylococcus aureus]
MRRWFVLILGLVILLSACGQKYDKEIDAVLNSERKSMSESSFKKPEKSNSDFKVYEDGKFITISFYDDMYDKDKMVQCGQVYIKRMRQQINM